MSVLSRKQIVDRIRQGDLVVSPVMNAASQIGPASIDLRLGTTAAVVRGSDLSHVDPKGYADAIEAGDHLAERSRRRKLERVSVPFGHRLLLHSGNLILVNTLEWVRLPEDLTGVVTARSSWAREGLSIATATFINPCYSGIITLELANLGQIPMALYPGMRLAQLALYSLDPQMTSPCDERTDGQFNRTFEPGSGDITKGDLEFIPYDK